MSPFVQCGDIFPIILFEGVDKVRKMILPLVCKLPVGFRVKVSRWIIIGQEINEPTTAP